MNDKEAGHMVCLFCWQLIVNSFSKRAVMAIVWRTWQLLAGILVKLGDIQRITRLEML
jgi:hypothetical protein